MNDQTFTFEPSGGLLNASLVMMDEETDSYWSIITQEAIWGEAEGTELIELPGAVKTTWADWSALHPETLVLSIDGKEHEEKDPYAAYYVSEKTFFELEANDTRLANKANVYSFHWQEKPYAIPHESFTGGGAFDLGERQLFLYRTADDSHYRSTSAFLAPAGSRFEKSGDGWQLVPQGWSFDPDERRFGAAEDGGVEVFQGFDTFWYIWSLTNDDTEVMTG